MIDPVLAILDIDYKRPSAKLALAEELLDYSPDMWFIPALNRLSSSP